MPTPSLMALITHSPRRKGVPTSRRIDRRIEVGQLHLVRAAAIALILFFAAETQADPLIPPLPSPPPAKTESEAGTSSPSEAIPVYSEATTTTLATATTFDEWTILITPAPRNGATSDNYQRIYESIPYRRAEYLANPSYRHDAAMELLFGQQRPTVIMRTNHAEQIVNPRPVFTQPYLMSQSELYRYRSLMYYGEAIPLLQPVP